MITGRFPKSLPALLLFSALSGCMGIEDTNSHLQDTNDRLATMGQNTAELSSQVSGDRTYLDSVSQQMGQMQKNSADIDQHLASLAKNADQMSAYAPEIQKDIDHFLKEADQLEKTAADMKDEISSDRVYLQSIAQNLREMTASLQDFQKMGDEAFHELMSPSAAKKIPAQTPAVTPPSAPVASPGGTPAHSPADSDDPLPPPKGTTSL